MDRVNKKSISRDVPSVFDNIFDTDKDLETYLLSKHAMSTRKVKKFYKSRKKIDIYLEEKQFKEDLGLVESGDE